MTIGDLYDALINAGYTPYFSKNRVIGNFKVSNFVIDLVEPLQIIRFHRPPPGGLGSAIIFATFTDIDSAIQAIPKYMIKCPDYLR